MKYVSFLFQNILHDHTWQQQCIVMLENYQNEEEQKNMTTVKNYEEEEKSYIATVHCNVRRVKKKSKTLRQTQRITCTVFVFIAFHSHFLFTKTHFKFYSQQPQRKIQICCIVDSASFKQSLSKQNQKKAKCMNMYTLLNMSIPIFF